MSDVFSGTGAGGSRQQAVEVMTKSQERIL